MSAKVVSVTKLGGHFCHHAAVHWSEDNRIALATVNGLHILEPQLKSQEESTIYFHRHFLPAPEQTNSFDVDTSRESLHDKLHRESLYSLMLDRTLSPFISNPQSFKGYKIACWSPRLKEHGDRCLLATMTSDHRVTIHREVSKRWEKVVEISSEFQNYIRERNYVDCTSPPTDEKLDEAELCLQQLKQRTYTLAANEMVWTRCFKPEIKNELGSGESIPHSERNFLSLILSMKSGHIVVWKISLPCTSSSNVSVLQIVDAQVGQITTLAWQQINQHSGLLAVGSHMGQIKVYLIASYWDNLDSCVAVDCKLVYTIWEEKDRISVSQMCLKKNTDNTFCFMAGKGNYFIGCEFVVADSLFILRQQTYCVGSHFLPITGICECQDMFVATSGDGCLQTIKLENTENGLSLKPQKVQLENSSSSGKQNLMGICQSPSGIFIAYCGRLLGYIDHLIEREPIKITVFTVHTISETVSLMLSHSGPLCEVFDAVTYIHLSTVNGEDCPSEFQDLILLSTEQLKDRSDYILKLVRWLLKLLSTSSSCEDDKIKLYSEKLSIVEEELVKRQLLKLVRAAINLKPNDITDEIREILRIAHVWLASKVTLNPNDQRLTNKLSSENDVPLNDYRYICAICSEHIPLDGYRSASCANGHKFARCCLTLRVCDQSTYSRCLNCKAMALNTEWNVGCRCTYCDGELK